MANADQTQYTTAIYYTLVYYIFKSGGIDGSYQWK